MQRKQATYTSSKKPVLEIPQHAVAPEQGYPKDIHKGFPDIPERKALDIRFNHDGLDNIALPESEGDRRGCARSPRV